MKPNQIYHSNSNKEAEVRAGNFFLEEMVAAAAATNTELLGNSTNFWKTSHANKILKSWSNFSVS